MIDFGFAELAVDDALLDAEVAQVLAAFAIVAGPERRPWRSRCSDGTWSLRAAPAAAAGLERRNQARWRAEGPVADLQHEVRQPAGVRVH